MNIAWLTWKDYQHPEAGGAEIVARELIQRLIDDGHTVTILTCGYPGALKRATLHGARIIRVGTNRYAHSFQALAYYMRHMRNRYDVVIEEVNAAPYFSVLFERKARKFLLYHQLEGPVWQFETKPPLSYIGQHVLEPIASRLVSLARTPVITISKSTANDLIRYGFAPDRMRIISEGIEIEPVTDLQTVKKYTNPTLLSLGAMRAMKRTLDQITAFERAKADMPTLQLKIAGKADGAYGKQVLARIEASIYKKDIEYMGKVSKKQKAELMQKSHIIMQTAIHEGWGLTVTEAASQGTPAVVYNVNGLRDSVRHEQTGLITTPHPTPLAKAMIYLLNNKNVYESFRRAAWEWSKTITFDQSYHDFKQIIGAKA